MLSLDFMVIAQFVRGLPGMLDIMGAGIDTINARAVPTSHPVGVAARFKFDNTESPGEPHRLAFILHGDDRELMTVRATIETPERPGGMPIHWKTTVNLALSLTLPLPRYGDYLLTLTIDDHLAHESDLRVIRREDGGNDGL
jgi:hypothetical protein